MHKSFSPKPRVVMFVRNNCNNDARVLKEARSLVQNGYEVQIIGLLTDTKTEQEERDGITITRVSATPMDRKLPHAAEVWLQAMLRLTLRVVESTARKRISPAQQRRIVEGVRAVFAYYWRSLEVALENPAAVYHGHDLSAILPAYIAARLTGGKVVYDSHELFTERNTSFEEGIVIKTALRVIEQLIIKRVDRVITVNRSIAEELQRRYKLKTLPAVVMNCPPLAVSDPTNLLRERLGISADQRIALYIGAISFNRGLEQTIEAMRYLDNVVFVVMGPGKEPYIETLREHAEKMGVRSRVYFVPPVPHTEVPRFASSATVSVAPIQNACLSYYYCTPNKLFESIMAGLPVVASNFPEMRAIIVGENLGLVFDQANPKSIAEAINKILDDPEKYQQMRDNAYRAAPRYSWETERKLLLQVYAELAPAPAPPSQPSPELKTVH